MKDQEVTLSHRQKQVCELVHRGLKNCQIAEELQLAEDTVIDYLSRIFAKLNVGNRTAVAMYWDRMLQS